MSKKPVCTLLWLLSGLFAASPVLARESQGSGQVTLKGSIIETACAIDTNSRDQTINMGQVPLKSIALGQAKKEFAINLVNCVLARQDKFLPDWQRFEVTFDGATENGLFKVDGSARGIAIKIIDKKGNVAVPGTPLPFEEIKPGNMKLEYDLHLVSNNQRLVAGNFSSLVKFKMDYY